MNDKFFGLKKEKQDRMINGVLKVFALQDYRHASTDEIVREAGISKGLLFHYFESKLGAYTFVYEYSARFMMLELNAAVDPGERDFFALLEAVAGARRNVMRGYPYLLLFLDRTETETEGEALEAVQEKKGQLQELYSAILAQADFSALPAGVDGEKFWRMAQYLMRGIAQDHMMQSTPDEKDSPRSVKELLDSQNIYQETLQYLTMLQTLVRGGRSV